ncbi:MAG: hypothetical protein P0Y65_13895 [Candidatus Devosia phytovorans]|uniref:Uncharacterized protein n=1 Tax=Candidatus Devosia phytovorans TaxID=3121372 RepID=A0AAJ5VSF8_9HYPH|nr:hypothetical protein [Devosia sp.]WEK03280.1 MAG: hypothetical protein P0Y65_13895 [Devosia sp.]
MVASESTIDTNTITTDPPSPNPPAPEEARALLESQSTYNLKQSALYAVRDLARALAGGKKADPHIPSTVRLVAHVELHFMALSLALPLRQAETAGNRPVEPDWADLRSVLSSASRDARYLKRLCNYGWVPDNVVEPLRILREIREKLEVIRRLTPEVKPTTNLAA